MRKLNSLIDTVIKSCWIILFSVMMGSCYNYNEPCRPPEKLEKQTLTYHALVYANHQIVNECYGGEEQFFKDLTEMFENTTRFWNNSTNKFKYNFRFVPKELRLYPTENYDKMMDEVRRPLSSAYDFIVIFNLDANHNGASCGTVGDHSVVWLTKTKKDQTMYGGIFKDGTYPDKLGTYSNLGHEYGHYRGATDIYQYPVKAHNNPINGEPFIPPKCNMGNGSWAWSDYASTVFNYTAHYKRLPEDWQSRRFPGSIEITVKREGQPVKNAVVKLYGCRGSGGGKKDLPSADDGPDVYKEPFRIFKTNADGKVCIDDPYRLYQVKTDGSEKLPKVMVYSYWFNFLVESEDENGRKAYVWMPDIEVQRQHLENESVNVFKTEINYCK